MHNAWHDLRFALRQLRRNPGFAVTAILTLALGIGANTAIFSLLDQALLRSLPVHDPASLVVLQNTGSWSGSISMSGGDQKSYFSFPNFSELRDHGHDFTGLAAMVSNNVGFSRNGTAQFANAEAVSGSYFETVGVLPALGRILQPSDDAQPGASPVAVVSYSFWRDKLGSDPSAVGSTLSISGHPFQIVGVSAPGFHSAVWGQDTGIWVPISMTAEAMPENKYPYTDHQARWLSIIGRLKPGIGAAQAATDNAPLWHALRASDMSLLGTRSARFTKGFMDSKLLIQSGARGFSFNRDSLQKPFLAVMAMAVLVLLIASVNVASLLMVRAAGRVREFSLRAALGASSSRVLSQLLLEGVLIGIGGGFVGVLLAPFAIRLLISRLADQSGQSPYTADLDHRVLLFNFAVAIAVSLCFSLVPARQLRRPDLTSTLRESTGTGAGGLLLLRRLVVCLQIGLSVILLVGAGLFIRTMQQLRAVDVGFQTSHLLSFNIDPQLAGYSVAQTPVVEQRVLDGLNSVPGIQSVSASDDQVLSPQGNRYGIEVSGYQRPVDDDYQVQNSVVTPDFLNSMKIPILAGRDLSATDTLDHPGATVVNEVFVKHFCNGSNVSCLGRHIGYGATNPSKIDMEIVGIFRDFRVDGIRGEIPAGILRPLKQTPATSQLFLYLRTALPPAQAIQEVQNAMRHIDPSLPVGTFTTMDQQIDIDLQNDRMITLLAIAFGVLATILAGVGLYGVLAYSTAQRTREIGIRMALGSTRLAVSSLILTDVLRLAALGALVAIPVAWALSILVRSQLFGVSAADPAILLAVVGVIAVVAFIAAVVPARRAANTSPMRALRVD